MTHNPNAPGLARIREAVGQSSKLTDQARQRLREGKLREAEMLAAEAVRICKDASYICTAGRELLAEVHLRRGEPGLALAEIEDEAKEGTNGLLSPWPFYTKAIALAQLGRKAEARAILIDTGGGAGASGGHMSVLRSRLFRWRLPMDGDDSANALVATGYLLRADYRKTQTLLTESLGDLQAALRLFPRTPVAHWMMASRLENEGRFEEAMAELKQVGSFNDSKAAWALQEQTKALQGKIDAPKPKTGG